MADPYPEGHRAYTGYAAGSRALCTACSLVNSQINPRSFLRSSGSITPFYTDAEGPSLAITRYFRTDFVSDIAGVHMSNVPKKISEKIP